MTYQQQAYQPTVIQPVVVQPVQLTGLRHQGIDVGKCHVPAACFMFMCFFGFGFIVMSIFMLSFDSAFNHFGHSPIRYPMMVLLSIGVIFAVISVGLILIHKRNKRRQESHDNTQPVSEPFTQDQMNQGSPMYVPVQSGPGLPYSNNAQSASYSAPMSNMQQPFQHGIDTAIGSPGSGLPYSDNAQSAPLGFDPATGAPQNMEPEKASFADYDQQPAFAPPAYSPDYDQQPAFDPPAYSS